MAAAVKALRCLLQFDIDEDPGSEPAGITLLSTFKGLDQQLFLGPTSAIVPALFSIYNTLISGGGYTIDTTAAQGTNGTINANGKKLLGVVISNPAASAGDVQIATGGSNGYVLPQPVKVKPGGFAFEWFASGLTAIDGTHKTLDITATDGDTPMVGLLFG
ncbi:MAG TPA: hypothetical protein VGG64_14255 [Pirellulales bacterium]|jgi:hypothetical protein